MITQSESIRKLSIVQDRCEECRKPVTADEDNWTLDSDPADHDPSLLLHDHCLSRYWQRVVDDHEGADAKHLKLVAVRLGVRRAVAQMLGATMSEHNSELLNDVDRWLGKSWTQQRLDAQRRQLDWLWDQNERLRNECDLRLWAGLPLALGLGLLLGYLVGRAS